MDEHGLKVWEKSKELGITPEEHILSLTKSWKDFCVKFDISYDSFYKTSDKEHHDKVKIIWDNFIKSGDIYKSKYSGKYCIGCESHKKDSDLVDDKCLDHPTTEITILEEDNYFFRLSKYKDVLLSWINKNPNFLKPQNKLEELKNLIINIEDISVSRLKENCPWGISVPNDDSQIIYVWLDALLNYIFAAGYLTDNFKWDNVIQLCGPDNLRFQAIIHQAFLESEGIKKSDKLLVHGTILDENGRKISKTLGNTIDPIDQLDKFGLYPVRYYALAGLNTYSNASWYESEVTNCWNSEIVNDWGNLISRVLHLIDTKCNGVLPKPEDAFLSIINDYDTRISELWNDFEVKDALQKTNELVRFANKYINDNKPWSSINFAIELANLKELLIKVNELYTPVFGSDVNRVFNAISQGKKQILFSRI